MIMQHNISHNIMYYISEIIWLLFFPAPEDWNMSKQPIRRDKLGFLARSQGIFFLIHQTQLNKTCRFTVTELPVLARKQPNWLWFLRNVHGNFEALTLGGSTLSISKEKT